MRPLLLMMTRFFLAMVELLKRNVVVVRLRRNIGGQVGGRGGHCASGQKVCTGHGAADRNEPAEAEHARDHEDDGQDGVPGAELVFDKHDIGGVKGDDVPECVDEDREQEAAGDGDEAVSGAVGDQADAKAADPAHDQVPGEAYGFLCREEWGILTKAHGCDRFGDGSAKAGERAVDQAVDRFIKVATTAECDDEDGDELGDFLCRGGEERENRVAGEVAGEGVRIFDEVLDGEGLRKTRGFHESTAKQDRDDDEPPRLSAMEVIFKDHQAHAQAAGSKSEVKKCGGEQHEVSIQEKGRSYRTSFIVPA